jgi:hypothetical protein
MINDNFLYGLASLMAGSTYTIPGYLAFGSTTGTLNTNDSVTSGEFDRNALDSKTGSLNQVKFYGSRLASEASDEYVNIISLTNSASLGGSGDIQVNFLVPSLLHTTSFDISVEAWVEFNR